MVALESKSIVGQIGKQRGLVHGLIVAVAAMLKWSDCGYTNQHDSRVAIGEAVGLVLRLAGSGALEAVDDKRNPRISINLRDSL